MTECHISVVSSHSYYIKVSGIPNGNKLMKTIWYPHMWRYDILKCEDIDDFTDIKFVPRSKHLRVFLESLQQSSEIFGNFRKMFGNVRRAFTTIFQNLRLSPESGRKSSENHQKRRQQYVYIIKTTLHVSSKMWILYSRGTKNIPLVRCAHSWDIVFATWT